MLVDEAGSKKRPPHVFKAHMPEPNAPQKLQIVCQTMVARLMRFSPCYIRSFDDFLIAIHLLHTRKHLRIKDCGLISSVDINIHLVAQVC